MKKKGYAILCILMVLFSTANAFAETSTSEITNVEDLKAAIEDHIGSDGLLSTESAKVIFENTEKDVAEEFFQMKMNDINEILSVADKTVEYKTFANGVSMARCRLSSKIDHFLRLNLTTWP